MVATDLLWLKQNNKYYRKIKIDNDALKLLPEDGQLTDLTTMMMKMRIDDDDRSTAKGQEDNTFTSFFQFLILKIIRNSVEEQQSTMSWPRVSKVPINEFRTEGYIFLHFKHCFPQVVEISQLHDSEK